MVRKTYSEHKSQQLLKLCLQFGDGNVIETATIL